MSVTPTPFGGGRPSAPASEALPRREAPLRASRPLLCVQLRGSQAEMGYQHGALLKAVGGYEETVDYYPRMPEFMLSASIPPAVVKTAGRAVVRAMTEALDRGRLPEFRERNQAFAEALGLPRRFSRATFVMDALQNIVGMARRYGLTKTAEEIGGAIPPACTTLSAWGAATADGRLLHGRNFDFPGIGVWEEGPTVVFCTPERGLRYGFVTTRGADCPGVSTFNEAGISVTTHTRFHRAVAARGVGIVDLVHEITRKAETLADAVAIAQERPVASSWGIHISSARERRALVVETAGSLCEVVEPLPGEDFVACTNRYRHPTLMRDEVTLSASFVTNSDGRLLRCRQVGEAGGVEVSTMKALLGSHKDPHRDEGERAAGSVVAQPTSVQSVVFDPERERLFVSVGPVPTGGGPWIEVDWAWGGAPGCKVLEGDLLHQAEEGSRFEATATQAARDAFVAAVAIENRAGPHEEALRLMERAVRLDPHAPTYRFLTGALHFKLGDVGRAREHLEAGLEGGQSPFYLGQTLLWAARAAQAVGDEEAAASLRARLLDLDNPGLADHRRAARRDAATPFTKEAMASKAVRLHLVDAAL